MENARSVKRFLPIVLWGGAIFLTITTVTLVSKSFRPEPKIFEAVDLPTPKEAEPQTQEIVSPNDQENRYVEAQKFADSSLMSLTSAVAEVDADVRLGRAGRWKNFAIVECNRLGRVACPSDRDWLEVKYNEYLTKLEKFTQSDYTTLMDGKEVSLSREQLPLDAETIQDYRVTKEILLDIATALTLRSGEIASRDSGIDTYDLNSAALEFSKAASRLNNLQEVQDENLIE